MLTALLVLAMFMVVGCSDNKPVWKALYTVPPGETCDEDQTEPECPKGKSSSCVYYRNQDPGIRNLGERRCDITCKYQWECRDTCGKLEKPTCQGEDERPKCIHKLLKKGDEHFKGGPWPRAKPERSWQCVNDLCGGVPAEKAPPCEAGYRRACSKVWPSKKWEWGCTANAME